MLMPYIVLGLAPDADDQAVRCRYLELTKRFPPSRAGDRFADIASSFESLKDARSRAQERALGAAKFVDAAAGLATLCRIADNALPTLATLIKQNEQSNGK
jgi:DnaJ-class molecular chaperone